MPDDDAFSHLLPKLTSQDWYLASAPFNKVYQKCIRRRVQAVLTKQIFSSPKAFPAGHIGNMSKGNDAGIGEICSSKPTWFDSRTAKEETGLDVAVGDLIGIYTDFDVQCANGDKFQSIMIAYELSAVGGELCCDQKETVELQYFTLDDAPVLFCKQHGDVLRDLRIRKGK